MKAERTAEKIARWTMPAIVLAFFFGALLANFFVWQSTVKPIENESFLMGKAVEITIAEHSHDDHSHDAHGLIKTKQISGLEKRLRALERDLATMKGRCGHHMAKKHIGYVDRLIRETDHHKTLYYDVTTGIVEKGHFTGTAQVREK